jgi:ABC-type Fe3+/spermidine/putrescine transport system ATPase subunit
MTHVTLTGLTKTYARAAAVQNLHLSFPPGKITALLGPSGCGKTTTLKMIAGLIEPTAGEIYFDDLPMRHVPAERRGAVMVFQNHLLFPHLSVGENVAFGLSLRGEARAEIRRKVAAMLARVRLEGLEARRPHQLSGGQAQRVALARALVVEPRVLLLDEPLSNLDAHLRDEMRELILELQRQSGITTLFVTHDQAEAVVLADCVALMLAGELQQVGTPRDLYERPANLAVARFFGGTNFIPGRRSGAQVATAVGTFDIDPAMLLTGFLTDLRTDEVILAVRPEDIVWVAAASAAQPAPNQVCGVVIRHTYVGTHTRLRVRVGGDPPAVELEVIVGANAAAQLAEGATVALHLPPAHIRLLPPDVPQPDVPQADVASPGRA